MSNDSHSPRVAEGTHSRTRTTDSHWIRTSDTTSYPPLTTDLEVDVAVVGGGIAGLSTAWELTREGGRSVVVLEADRIATGVTGFTTAKVTAQHGMIYDRLRRTRGTEGARLYARSQQAAVERVAEVASALGIECEFERGPSYVYSRDGAERSSLKSEAEAAAEAGLDAAYVEDTGLPFPVAGAVRVEEQAQFHPRKYLLALAHDLTAYGNTIHERTRVTGLQEGTPCRLTTESGFRVTARDVVVATHFPVFDRALLFARMSPRRELVVAAPLPTDRDPAGMYITEDGDKRSVRTAPLGDGRRLLIVTGEHFTPGTADVPERIERLDEWMHTHFAVEETRYRWAAQDNDPSDRVPLIGPFHPGARHTYVATGFGGWGMSGGVLAGRLLTGLICAVRPPWTDLYDPRRLWSTLREAPTLISQQAEVGRHFVGDRLRTTHVDSASDIAPGTGAVVRLGGRRCAVYRDDEGVCHAVSARCTHLGCLVSFNEAERSWDCPCHGSRFAVDGSVLNGPALRPLEVRHVDGSDGVDGS
ncbi:FAD-dependent oxidoreductase [Streptomyces xantholiticus]|uniref:FAD-dependent oxidoreductase n=1 Tax=Streptomyces xantholiticus TaxID=68285 RepID=UPI001677330E|nr:FAD-dependent oxidoreductase [Streptomyces xantholiticus]GGW40287.1 iron-sulfur-binding protein [Streptomyces xantholiticus]